MSDILLMQPPTIAEGFRCYDFKLLTMQSTKYKLAGLL